MRSVVYCMRILLLWFSLHFSLFKVRKPTFLYFRSNLANLWLKPSVFFPVFYHSFPTLFVLGWTKKQWFSSLLCSLVHFLHWCLWFVWLFRSSFVYLKKQLTLAGWPSGPPCWVSGKYLPISPVVWVPCCFMFRFAFLIMVSIVSLYQTQGGLKSAHLSETLRNTF